LLIAGKLQPVLYVEDDENDVIFLRMAFENAQVLNPLQVVSDGRLAMDYLLGIEPYSNRDEFPLPCLVLLDIKLPKKSGLEVLQWMRVTPEFVSVPVIILSSSSSNEDIHRAYAQGSNGYLVKPGSPKELLVLAKAIKDYWLDHNRNPPRVK
jgi:DNA-binding response OmpR family regulator